MDDFEVVDMSDADHVKPNFTKLTEHVKLLQVCILLDTTGSMTPYFDAVITSLKTLLLQMPTDKQLSVALVRFNDYSVDSNKAYKPREASCCIATTFTSAAQIIAILEGLFAGGGGDAPEALSLALRFAADTTKIAWDPRPCVSKTIILATDAPPHGLGYSSGDTFPLGDPDTGPNGCGPQLRDGNGECMHLDPLTYINQLKHLDVAVHTIKVGSSTDPKLDVFMKHVANVTNGKAMALNEVSNLGDVIAGVSLEDAACTELAGAIASEMEKLMLDGASKEAAAEAAVAKVAATVDAEVFVSVDAKEIPLDTESEGVFRSLSSEINLKSFRSATETLTTKSVPFPTYSEGPDTYRSLGDCEAPRYASLGGYDASARHISAMETMEEEEEDLGHPVYRSLTNFAHTSEPVLQSPSYRAAPTPPSTPSSSSSKSSVKRGLTPALLARAAMRAASST
jgi:hypothetical protein